MKILVTGANGQLGNEMRILAKMSSDTYVFSDIVDASEESIAMLKKLSGDDVDTNTIHLDITKLEEVRALVKQENVDIIVNCAAYTNVDAAENNAPLAELLNAKAPENLAVVMKESNGLLVHISTDYVFGGASYNTPCKEDQQGAPTGVYGLTKLHGEQAIQKVGCEHVIIRTAWLYSEFGKNFVKTMLNLIDAKPKLKVVFDQVGTPTYAYDLAAAIFDIIENRKFEGNTGIYHYSNEGVCSWYDFSIMISKYAGNKDCDIRPCHSNEFPSPVKRPSYSVLDKTIVKNTFSVSVPHWTESLIICIENLKL